MADATDRARHGNHPLLRRSLAGPRRGQSLRGRTPGVFSFRPLPPRQPEPGSTAREARARRGSEVIFRTTLSAYVSGVLAAEQAGLGGQAGLALAQVIAHDAARGATPGPAALRHDPLSGFPRHGATHARGEPGTRAGRAAHGQMAPLLPRWGRAVGGPALRAEVRAALGEVQRFGGRRAHPGGRPEHRRRAPPVRAGPRSAAPPGLPDRWRGFEGETVRIRGRGRGHGLGLDVEAARTSGLTAAELLRRAYGLDVTP